VLGRYPSWWVRTKSHQLQLARTGSRLGVILESELNSMFLITGLGTGCTTTGPGIHLFKTQRND